MIRMLYILELETSAWANLDLTKLIYRLNTQ